MLLNDAAEFLLKKPPPLGPKSGWNLSLQPHPWDGLEDTFYLNV